MKHVVARSLMALAVFSLGAPAAAQGPQVLWKLVDKQGRVTYSDQPPKDFDGVATRLDLPIETRIAPAPTAAAPTASGGTAKPPTSAPAPSAELLRARAKLEEARKAYESGKEAGPEDVVWIGRKGGGARPEISDSYAARVRQLEEAVKLAEGEVQRLEQGSR